MLFLTVKNKNKYNLKKIQLILALLFVFVFRLSAASIFDYPISTVFIDAGHGGVDSGAVSSYDFNKMIYEKDIVLDIALKIKNHLESEIPELNIILTREDDTFPSLQKRGEISYKTILPSKSGSLFISIHANSSSTDASGFEVFTKLKDKIIYLYDENTPLDNISLYSNDNLFTLNRKQYDTSLELSSNILESVTQFFPQINDRGIKSDDLYVLNACRTTSCLVEVGFLSNEEEAKKLLDNTYRDSMAKAISDGIVKTIKNRR